MEEEKGIKIGTEDEKFWTDIKDSATDDIERLEKLLKFQRAVLELANANIAKEQEA